MSGVIPIVETGCFEAGKELVGQKELPGEMCMCWAGEKPASSAVYLCVY